MELGDFFSGVLDVGQAYLASKFQPQAPISPIQFLPNPSSLVTPQAAGVGTVLAPGNPGQPPAVIAGGSGCNTGPKPVWKMVCGQYKWVVPKRRRRRQLITQSDAAGLAKLKGIVGQGKTMEIWIATHSKG